LEQKVKVLFLCVGNSCRSQMAEGWARRLLGERVEPYSAGVDPGALDLRAVAVMGESGVDISGHRAKPLSEVMHVPFDLVVTVCDRAQASCPLFPGPARVVHRGFDDPPRLAAGEASGTAALAHYRRVRDEIRTFVAKLDLAPGAGDDPDSAAPTERAP
jgi:arsenate reductase